MKPSKEAHEFSIAVEPRTGIPLKINAQLQINVLMKPYEWTPLYYVPEVMMPMFWFRQAVSCDANMLSSDSTFGFSFAG